MSHRFAARMRGWCSELVTGERGQSTAEYALVILGAAEPAYVEMMAETVTAGDPTYTGPLAGVSLGLPVVHILEPEVKQQVDPEVYSEQVGLLELTVDTEVVHAAMRKLRGE